MNFFIESYENNSDLKKELNYAKDNVCNIRDYDDSIENHIVVTDKYLSFSYHQYNEEDEYYFLNTVIVSRNYKQFYFIYPHDIYEDINVYQIRDNKVCKYNFKNHQRLFWRKENYIDKSISKLLKV